jgi:GTP-binding protein
LNLDEELILADIPGLIEGASEGLGLGDEFLRHIERTRVLLHLVDVAARPELGAPGPAEAWRIIRKEVEAYSPALATKPTIIGLNKCELVSPEELEACKKELEGLSGKEVMLVSGATGEGIKALLWRCIRSCGPSKPKSARPARRWPRPQPNQTSRKLRMQIRLKIANSPTLVKTTARPFSCSLGRRIPRRPWATYSAKYSEKLRA